MILRRAISATSLAAIAAAAMVSLTPAAGLASEPVADITDLCLAAAAAEERAGDIPDALLQSLALAESGRRDEETRSMVTWPWTVMAEGEGRYYPSKEAAVADVERLQAKGVRNIDVGCMQINLMHHADAFETIEEALDPETNVAYGAHYLSALQRETGSWFTAIKRYHSARPTFHLPYRQRVFQIWRDTKERQLAEAERSKPPLGEISESMSATINPWSELMAKLPLLPTPESRKNRWQDAFRQSSAAISEWRRIGVSEASQAHGTARAIVAEQTRKAMRVLRNRNTDN